MRIGIEKLAWLLSAEPGDATLGELADRHSVTTERIMDAMDVLKIRRGSPTQLPAVRWDETPPRGQVKRPKTPCDNGFHWIGQPWYSCDMCGLPAWEHAGMAEVAEGTKMFDFGKTAFVLKPWKPGEADAIQRRWQPDYEQWLAEKSQR